VNNSTRECRSSEQFRNCWGTRTSSAARPEFAARLMDYGAIARVSMPVGIRPHDKSSYGMEAAETKGLVAAR
jgi:hypothetical protein